MRLMVVGDGTNERYVSPARAPPTNCRLISLVTYTLNYVTRFRQEVNLRSQLDCIESCQRYAISLGRAVTATSLDM